MNDLDNLETIENYLNGQLPADERARFETALRTDPAVADTLAFYVLTKEAARRQAREQRIAELKALRQKPVRQPVIQMAHQGGSRPASGTSTRPLSIPVGFPMQWVAAASLVLLLGIGWAFFQNRNGSSGIIAANATQQVDSYIAAEYDHLTLSMGGSGSVDSLTQGVGLYNKQEFAQAEAIFQDFLARKPNDEGANRALKFAGLAALRQSKYDAAIERFGRLSQRTDLLDTSGPFLEALARIKRNQPIDKAQAKNLLERVIRENLEGKGEAEELLKSLN